MAGSVRTTLGAPLAALLVASVAAGCGPAAAPTATPGDLTAVRGELARAGITTLSATSGDSACPAVDALTDNVVHLTVRDPGSDQPRDVFLYLFRPREYGDSEADMDACAASFASTRAGEPVIRLDVAPYRALGSGWSVELRGAVEGSLREAAGAPTAG